MISIPLTGYVLTAARRDKLIWTLVLMVLLGASTSVFLGGAAMVEQEQFSTVFASGGLRILGMTGLVLFVSFYMRRAFEHKEVEFLLSRPVSRMTFLFSHTAAFVVLAVLIAALVTLPLVVTGVPNGAGLVVWSASIAVEYAIMAVAALFFSVVLSSAAGAALAAFGFYVLARLIGTLLGIAALPAEDRVTAVLAQAMDMISIIVPRLDLMGQTSWLVYGVEGSAAGLGVMEHAGPAGLWLVTHLGAGVLVAAQGVLFVALLLAAAAYDFSRRRF